MKVIKFLSLFIFSFLFINIIFSFNIYDIDTDKKENYFSIEKSKFYVIVDDKNFPINVKYEINNNTINKDFFLYEKCKKKNCIKFSINDFFIFKGDGIIIPKKINIGYKNDTKQIFFDIEKPIQKKFETEIDKVGKKLFFNFDFFDNRSGISEINIFLGKKNPKKLKSLNNNEKKFSYDILNKNIGETIFFFEVKDKVGNKLTKEIKIEIPDLYAPNYKIGKIIKNENFNLDLDLFDNDKLKKIEIFNNGILLFEKNLNSKNKNINFLINNTNLKKIQIKISDKSNNIFTDEIFLEDILNTNIINSLLKNTTFKITSNSQNCFLSKVSNKKILKNFTKTDISNFEIILPNIAYPKSEIEFFCEDKIFKIYYKEKIIINENLSDKYNFDISVNKNKTGIEIKRDNDKDKNLEYEIYRDGKKITNLNNGVNFLDNNLSSNKTYEYELIVKKNEIEIYRSKKKEVTTPKLNEDKEDISNLDISNKENYFSYFYFLIFMISLVLIGYITYINKNLLNFNKEDFLKKFKNTRGGKENHIENHINEAIYKIKK